MKSVDYAKSLDLGLSFLYETAGIVLSNVFDDCSIFGYIGTIAALAKLGGTEFLKRNEFLRNKLNERSYLIKPDKPMDKQAARFLSQINPVARLKIHC